MSRPRTRLRAAGRLLPALMVAVPGTAVAACSEDPIEAYCDVVAEERQVIGAAGEEPGGLIAVHDSLERLGEAAPPDLRDEWDQILLRVGTLREALEAAGVDPGSYDPQQPVEGVGEQEEQAISDAAVALVDPAVMRAVRGVEQHALDVCRTPLGL